MNRVVDKAIQEFLHVKAFSPMANRGSDYLVEMWNGAESIPGTIFKGLGAGLGQLGLLLIVRSIFWVLDQIYSGGMKFGSSWLLEKFDVVNTLLDSTNRALYDDSQYTSDIDDVLLDQLKELERLLQQEGGDLKLYEGDNGKRLFQEFTENLFAVLDKRGNLTTQQRERRDNLLVQTKEALEDMADEKLKQAVMELLIFAYQSIRTEDHMNATLVNLLKKANESMMPRKHPIHNLYSEKMQQRLAMELGADPTDQDLLVHFAIFESGKVSQTEIDCEKRLLQMQLGREPTTREIVLHYREKEEIDSILKKVLQTDLDMALKRKYQKTEDEIRAILTRILKKSVEDVVVSQAETLLKTPKEALVDHLTWMENQFIHKRAAAQTVHKTYIDAMREQIASLKIAEESKHETQATRLCETHLHMMRQMQSNLKVLADKEHASNSMDTRIRSVYEISEEIFPTLQTISEQIIEYQASKNPSLLTKLQASLTSLQAQVEAREPTIHGIKHSLQSSDGPIEQTVKKWKDWAIQEAAAPCVEHITGYAHGRLNKRAQEAIHMYKDPNTLPLLLRHVVGLPYLNKKPYTPVVGTKDLYYERSPRRREEPGWCTVQ